jgi:hypothetical protein
VLVVRLSGGGQAPVVLATTEAATPEIVLPEPEELVALEPLPDAAEAPPTDEPEIESPPEAASEPSVEPLLVEVPERVALADPSPSPVSPVSDEPPATTEIDPLGFDPGEVELVLRRGPESPGRDEPSARETPSLADPSAEPSLDERLAAAARQAGVYVERGPSDAATGPPTLAADEALSQVVPSADLRGIPLDEALTVFAALSGAPITVDPAALRQAGVGADHPIDIVGEGQTVGELLAAALKPLRLGVRIEGVHVVIERLGGSVTKIVTHQLKDLGDVETLTDLVRATLPIPTEAKVEGSGSLSFDAPMATHYELAVLCERLRIARGLPTATRYPRSLLSIEPSFIALAPVLDRRTTFSFIEPTPLTEVFSYWRRATGLAVLVDWRAVGGVGLGPKTTVRCAATNRPWRAALDGVLEPLGLAWAAVDARTLCISAAGADWPATVEYYPTGQGGELPSGAVAVDDAASGRRLVAAPADVQRVVAERFGLGAPGAGE